ncbi:MAG: hypothetical protein IKI06_10240 [Prevotella sp.]|nr:hypothetical protein [Prevotella sp.]
MKKFYLNSMHYCLLILLFNMVCSCTDSDSSSDSDSKTSWWSEIPEKIVGDWVYDHPEESVWEIMSFTKTGVFTYSNDSYWDIHNENVTGRYYINEDKLTGTYYRDGITLNLDVVIKSINNYEFTAKFNDTGLTFTYSKRISVKEMKIGETITPDYEYDLWHSLNGNATKDDAGQIFRYSSHNIKVATVDANSGEITAVGGGRTYIDVVTDKGTAVVEVNIEEPKYFVAYDYTQFIGATKKTVIDTFEGMYTSEDDTMIYNYKGIAQQTIKDVNWEVISFTFNHDTQLVVSITLKAKDDVWFTNEEMYEYLSHEYYVYEQGTEDSYKAFINEEKYDDATVGITWDYNLRTLTYTKIDDRSIIQIDYSYLLGKTNAEAKEAMNGITPSVDTEETLSFMLNDDYVRTVICQFKNTKNELKDVIQIVQVRLQNGIDQEAIKTELASKYQFTGESAGTLFYYNTDKSLEIKYVLEYNMIQYRLR